MAITNENLYSESYTEISNFLNSIPSLDPKNRYKTNIIHASMPNINSKGFSGYPFIVLLINSFEEEPSFDGQISDKIFRAEINIYAEDPSNLDNISDKVARYFKNESYLTQFEGKELNSSPINYLMDLKGKKILYRTIFLTFSKRI